MLPRPSNSKLTSGLSILSAPRAKRLSRIAAVSRSVRSSAAATSGLCFPPLGLGVRQACPATDDGTVEERFAARWQFDGEAQLVLVRAQAATVVRELRRQHRRRPSGHVRREGALGRAAVERRAGLHVRRDVRDVDPRPITASLSLDGDRVVEVLCRLRIDRERQQLTQVDALSGLRRVGVRLELGARAGVHEQSFEDDLNVLRLAEHALELRAPTAGTDDSEVAGTGIAETLAVEHERNARHEVRLAHDELAALLDLDDGAVGQVFRLGGSAGSSARILPRRAAVRCRRG